MSQSEEVSWALHLASQSLLITFAGFLINKVDSHSKPFSLMSPFYYLTTTPALDWCQTLGLESL
jgi:hypothetical protein